MMKSILLSQNKITQVDDEDFEYLNQFKWSAIKWGNNKFYACRNVKSLNKAGRTTLYMHIAIMNHKGIDHIDGDGLNNQKSNLRITAQANNVCNASKSKGTSRYKGVHFDKGSQKWRARITKNKVKIDLGCHAHELTAAAIYDVASTYYFGEFARRNFPKKNSNGRV